MIEGVEKFQKGQESKAINLGGGESRPDRQFKEKGA